MELPRWVWVLIAIALVGAMLAFGGGSGVWDGSDCQYGGRTQDLSC